MLIPVILFWISLSALFFCYVGYGMLLYFINYLRKSVVSQEKTEIACPPVTVVITAYNEADILEKKIRNTLAIDYPDNQLHIIIVTDGSTDGSEMIVERYPSVLLLHQAERQGKLAAVKRAMMHVKTPIVIFSDANAMLNKECITRMVKHYEDPSTGGVAGEKKIQPGKKGSAVGEAEGLYWNYESFMKKLDADFNTVVGAAGELYSIRTALFPSIDDHIILDDFVVSLKICLAGYRIAYEPEAFAEEWPSLSIKEEAKRKIRIAAGAYQSIGYLGEALNIFKHPLLSFQYISRRLLRWIFCPLLLPVLLITNILLVFHPASPFIYIVFLFEQLSFYIAAIAGFIIIRSGRRAGILTIPFYFVFMNYCLIKGFARFLKGGQDVKWEKSMRQATR